MTPKPTTDAALSSERIAEAREDAEETLVNLNCGPTQYQVRRAETTLALITEREAWVAEREEMLELLEQASMLTSYGSEGDRIIDTIVTFLESRR